ncbi:MAG: HEAT repeat domain-containing protein [Cyanobacteria bacterium J06638_20]
MSDLSSSLIQAIEDADSAEQRREAVQNLAAARLEAAIPILIAILSDRSPGATAAAVNGLIQLGAPAVPALLAQLERNPSTDRVWAIRALAEIGDPRGFMTLLGAATADFALPVRRAAARGLGQMQWQRFPLDLRNLAQEEAMEALIFVAQQDDEWRVRYSATLGLESLMATIAGTHPTWALQIQTRLEHLATHDSSWAVRARARMAWQQHQIQLTPLTLETEGHTCAHSMGNWQVILEKLYERKGQERLILAEGDPRRYYSLAESVASQQGANVRDEASLANERLT